MAKNGAGSDPVGTPMIWQKIFKPTIKNTIKKWIRQKKLANCAGSDPISIAMVCQKTFKTIVKKQIDSK